jgi:hypothetical protein
MIPDSLAALRKIALGYALLFDDKRADAVLVWAQIVKEDPATDFISRAVYARVQGKPQARPLVPDPTNFNEFLAVLQ